MKQGILAYLFDQYLIIVTVFCTVTINSLLFVEYVKLYKALRPGKDWRDTEILSFRSYKQLLKTYATAVKLFSLRPDIVRNWGPI